MTRGSARPDVLIVGGGIVGCAVALATVRRGLAVLVVERGEPGRGATWAAGGMLSPLAEAPGPGPFLDLGLASLEGYPSFVDSVEERSGRRVGFRRSGKLVLAGCRTSETRLRERLEWIRRRGSRAEWLDPDDVRRREPAVAGQIRGALLLPDEARVDNRLLGVAVAEAAREEGAKFRTGVAARRIVRGGGRATGVELADGTCIDAGSVVVAAGAWSGRLGDLPRPLPIRPVRGQMVGFVGDDDRLGTIVDSEDVYLVPRAGGRIVAGSTMEDVGFRAAPTLEGVSGLLEAVIEAVPAMADAELVEAWAGLRPAAPDELPVIGPDPELEGLFYATGHFRNGILLAPITADCLAPLIEGAGRPAVDLEAFRPDRFDETTAGERLARSRRPSSP